MYEGLKVAVTLSDSAILKIEVLEDQETAPGWPALEKLPEAIIAAQSLQVDTIAGATRTSEGILAAVKDALTKANVDVAQFEKSVEEAPAAAESYYPVMGSFKMHDKWAET